MSHIFRIIFTVFLILFFSAFQSSANEPQDKILRIEKLEGIIGTLEVEIQQRSEGMSLNEIEAQTTFNLQDKILRIKELLEEIKTSETFEVTIKALEALEVEIKALALEFEIIKASEFLEVEIKALLETLKAEVKALEAEVKALEADEEAGVKALEAEVKALEADEEGDKQVITEINRIIALPGKVARGEATEEEIQECKRIYEANCPIPQE